ncbi:hypothetical protein L873DRAFT_1807416 [Choiromyces venosus 120613-1]|uniref:SWIM-type domain-containing protein n=1 Tax=Choiromyces venosus 120613-1 TaxID=1336337 RepID=A0A3N4JL56_9PEZI|nr:hypothetical protein L873DRAFT_1807416 [Choiromyces venosus 120613-1]
MADNYHGLVQSPSQIACVVDFEYRTCSCRHFQDTNITCQHPIACILTLRHRVGDYIPYEFLVDTWKHTYCQNFPPIILPKTLPTTHPPYPRPFQQPAAPFRGLPSPHIAAPNHHPLPDARN